MTTRTTIVLDEGLAKRLREQAAERGVGLSRHIGDLLKHAMAQRERAVEGSYRLDWPVVRGERTPSVDIADRGQLYDLMEQRP